MYTPPEEEEASTEISHQARTIRSPIQGELRLGEYRAGERGGGGGVAGEPMKELAAIGSYIGIAGGGAG